MIIENKYFKKFGLIMLINIKLMLFSVFTVIIHYMSYVIKHHSSIPVVTIYYNIVNAKLKMFFRTRYQLSARSWVMLCVCSSLYVISRMRKIGSAKKNPSLLQPTEVCVVV